MSSLLPRVRNTESTEKLPVVSSRSESARISPTKFFFAILVAFSADVLFAIPSPLEPIEIFGDIIVVVILSCILGFNWMFLPALLAEAVPGLDIFPCWTLAVIALINRKQSM